MTWVTPERRAPIHLADADRIGDDLDGAAALGLRIVVEPMLGQIDDDALVRARRQNVPARNHELLAGARQPGIDARD